MEIYQPGKNNNDDVKPGRLEADAEIYNPDRKEVRVGRRSEKIFFRYGVYSGRCGFGERGSRRSECSNLSAGSAGRLGRGSLLV